jgi:CheY-like chemotaxis protein
MEQAAILLPMPIILVKEGVIIKGNKCFNRIYKNICSLYDIFPEAKETDLIPTDDRMFYNTLKDCDGEQVTISSYKVDDDTSCIVLKGESENSNALVKDIDCLLKASLLDIQNGISLLRDGKVTTNQFEAIKAIEKGQHSLNRLCNDINDVFNPSTASEPCVFHTKQFINEIIAIVHSRFSAEINVKFSKDLPYLAYGRKKEMRQLLINLLYGCCTQMDHDTNLSDNITLNVGVKSNKQISLEKKEFIAASRTLRPDKTKTIEMMFNISCNAGVTEKDDFDEPTFLMKRINERLCERLEARVITDSSEFYQVTVYIPAKKISKLEKYLNLFQETFINHTAIIISDNPHQRLELLRLFEKWKLNATATPTAEELAFVLDTADDPSVIVASATLVSSLPPSTEHIPLIIIEDEKHKDTLHPPLSDNRIIINHPFDSEALMGSLSRLLRKSTKRISIKPRRVLVADDDVHYQNTISDIIKETGTHQIETVGTSDFLYEYVQLHKPDIIFLDMYLTSNIKGQLRHLRTIYDGRPHYIVLLSTKDSNKTLLKSLKKSRYCNHIVRKPLTARHLTETMRFADSILSI